MTRLRQRMIEDIQLRGFSPKTQEAYLRQVCQLVERCNKSPEKIAFPTENGKGAADLLDCFIVVPSKVSDSLKVGSESAQQSHQFHIAVSLLLQPAA